jgi:hypothetical protein
MVDDQAYRFALDPTTAAEQLAAAEVGIADR